jgi:probable addiction module antidote protein
MAIKTTRFDPTKYLEAEDYIELLNEALANHDAKLLVHTIGTVARARGMSELARRSGINRSSLYAALADDANPTIETIMKVLDALKIELQAQEQAPEAEAA